MYNDTLCIIKVQNVLCVIKVEPRKTMLYWTVKYKETKILV